MEVTIKKIKCLRCNHEWTPRKEVVRVCSKCKSAYWDIEKSKKTCKMSQKI